jgi:MoxR-like ATPase
MTQTASETHVLQPDQLKPLVHQATEILDELNAILLGRPELHRFVMAGILARGHILLEGLPGVGKTALIKALGEILHLEFKRVQFTPDLMPGDILGTHILQEMGEGRREMTFQAGPIFTNILLADEINRASPKTQSALLEAMQERCVTLLGNTRKLPEPFFVLASQNPIELEGTYPLPEAQLDRFLFKLRVPSADIEILEGIIGTRRRGIPPVATRRLGSAHLNTLFDTVDAIVLPRAVAKYISRLVAGTHPDSPYASERIKRYVSYGASPRAAIGMAEASRAYAFLCGRPTVGFDDVKAVANPALNHRLILNYKAKFDGVTTHVIVEELLASISESGVTLPTDLQIAPRSAATPAS